VDARFILGEQCGEGLLTDRDRPHRGRAVTVKIAEVVEMAAKLVQCPAGLEEIVAANHLAEYRPDPIERGLDPDVERLELDLELVQDAPPRVGSAQEVCSQLGMARDFSLEAAKHGIVNRRPEGREIGNAGCIQCGYCFVVGLYARGRCRIDAGEERALKLVERGRQDFRGPVVEAWRHDGRLSHRADQRAAVLRDLVGSDCQDGNCTEGD